MVRITHFTDMLTWLTRTGLLPDEMWRKCHICRGLSTRGKRASMPLSNVLWQSFPMRDMKNWICSSSVVDFPSDMSLVHSTFEIWLWQLSYLIFATCCCIVVFLSKLLLFEFPIFSLLSGWKYLNELISYCSKLKGHVLIWMHREGWKIHSEKYL